MKSLKQEVYCTIMIQYLFAYGENGKLEKNKKKKIVGSHLFKTRER